MQKKKKTVEEMTEEKEEQKTENKQIWKENSSR